MHGVFRGRYTVLMSAIDTIREMKHREPFEPFRVRQSSGDSYIVENPDLIALLKSEVFIAAPNSDRRTFVPYLHIAAVETIANGNGRHRRRRRG